ncbi:MAG: 30S ribosomal protein S20 [Candidatus Kaiserbacteria bacterium]|nr:30S ribosomal protein S20 [Candidatus Kaiserbacteria bacterium]
MANTTAAKKAMRVSARKRVFNMRRLRTMRSLMKEVVARHRRGDSAGAREQYQEAQKAIDKAAKRGVIKHQTASRRKAMLARSIKPSAVGGN